MPTPMVCVPRASMHARAIQGLTSLSPMPLTPSSVWISTTMSSCADDVAPTSTSGCSRTWQSIPVIRIRSPRVSGCLDDSSQPRRAATTWSYSCVKRPARPFHE